MGKIKVPNTFVIIFTVIAICAVATWLIPGGNPQTWQIFSALYEGFSQQAGIIAFVLIIGGTFEIEKGRLSFRLTAPYGADRRKAASEYAKQNNKLQNMQ